MVEIYLIMSAIGYTGAKLGNFPSIKQVVKLGIYYYCTNLGEFVEDFIMYTGMSDS